MTKLNTTESQGQIPLPQDDLMLLDIDGTLIDHRYWITDPDIYRSIQSAQELGWAIGLSSDTPYEAMTLWSNRLGLNGPIIAERGSVTSTIEGLAYAETTAASFLRTKEQAVEYFKSQNIAVVECNPVEALRDNQVEGSPGETIVLMNDLRICSFSFFVRTIDETGNPTINEALTDTLVGEIRQFYPEDEHLEEDLNHDYGLVIVAPSEVNKRFGSRRVMAGLHIAEFAMVGNSMSDFVGSDIAKHYAVANATPEFKQTADYIAQQNITSGVVEIIDCLSQARLGR